MINILHSSNYKVFRGICLNMLTVMKYTKEPVHLHLMTMEVSWSNEPKIPKESADHLREVMKSFNPLNELTYYDISLDFEKRFKDSPNRNPKYTPGTLIRLMSPRYLNCDKVIYLDTDIMTCSSLEAFNEIDIESKEIGVAKDYMGRFWIRRDYFNAGVLYINLKKVRETQMFEKALKLLDEKKYYFSDQTALYKASTLRRYMPFRFNEQRKIKSDTVVKHFCKGIRYFPFFKIYNYKQWNVEKVHSFLKITMFDDIYKQYEELFPNEAPLDYGKEK